MSGTTISGVYLSTVTLSGTAQNPAIVTGVITPGAGVALKGVIGTNWSVVNQGTIASSGSAGIGIALASGGSVSNSGLIVTGTQGTLANGGTAGVYIYGSPGTVTNSGTIAAFGTNGIGVRLQAGGSVTNSGTIGGSLGASLGGAGYVTNLSGGTVYGVAFSASASGVNNQGSIIGTSGVGIELQAGGFVDNSFGASIVGDSLHGSTAAGVYILGAQGSVVNQGYIGGHGGFIPAASVELAMGGGVSNAATGTIAAYSDLAAAFAVELRNGGTLFNSGSIVGNGHSLGSGFGVGLYSGGVIFNASGGVIGFGGEIGVYGKSSTSIATVVNAGVIHGMRMNDAVVSNASTGLINNFVLLSGTGNTVMNLGTLAGLYGVTVSSGMVSNAAGARIIGYDQYNNASYGLLIDAGTVTNAGTIEGGIVDALKFGLGATNLLIADPGAVFAGTVDGGNTIGGSMVSTFELSSGSSQGTLTGLGSRYIDFAQTTIDIGASWALTGTSPASNILRAGATLTNYGQLTLASTVLTDAGGLVNDGTIVLGPSTLTAYSLTGSGMITMDGGSTLAARGGVSSGQTIDFTGPDALVKISDTIGFAGTMTSFAASDTIELSNFTAMGSVYAGGVLTLSSTGGPVALALPGTFTTTDFVVTTNGGNTDVSLVPVCFCAGTRIDTPDGERAIESLVIGDKVLLASGAESEVVWIGSRRIDLTRHAKPQLASPIRILRGAFGNGLPRRDLLLSPDHSIFAEDVLIPIKHLINGSTVVRERGIRAVWYLHVELPTHDIMLAEGLAVESYLDVGDRGRFDNAARPISSQPGFAALRWEGAGGAELKLLGPAVDAMRARLCYHARRVITRAA